MRGPPGPPSWQQLPLGLRILRDPRAVVMDETARYGPLWQSQMPGRRGMIPVYWLMGPEGNERILAPPYRQDFSWYEGYGLTMEAMLGRDILFLLDDTEADAAHRRRHRQILPALHPRMDEAYVEAMAAIMLARMATWPRQGELDLGAEIKQITFRVVARLLFGAEEGDVPALYHDFEELGLGLYAVLKLPLPGTRFSRGLAARGRLSRYIERRVAAGRAGGGAGTLLAELLKQRDEDGAALPDQTLVSEMLAFLFAGYDTTASLLTSFFVCLAERPDVCEALGREARDLGAPSFDGLAELPWLCAALTEAERLQPPLVFALRGVLRAFTFGGYEIGAGSKVIYSAYYTGRLPSLFPDPERFQPERFLDGKRPPPYSVLGFGGGHRACIGKRFALLEMRLFSALLFQRFALRLPPAASKADDVFFNPTLQRRGGYRVQLSARRSP